MTFDSSTLLSLDPNSNSSGLPMKFKKMMKSKIAIAGGVVLIIGIAVGAGIYFANNNNHDNSSILAVEINVGSDPVELGAGLYNIPSSNLGQIYTLYRKSTDPNVNFDTPAARSYDGNIWEPIFPLLKTFECSGNACVLKISSDEGDFVIVPSDAMKFKDEEMVADFLIQSTFGPTPNAMKDFPKGLNFRDRVKGFILEQISIPATLHREYYRKSLNPLMGNVTLTGRSRGPCEIGSRWDRAAADNYDSNRPMQIRDGNLYIDGEFRTKLPNSSLALIPNLSASYVTCGVGLGFTGMVIRFAYANTGNTNCPMNFPVPLLNFSSSPPISQIVHQNADFSQSEIDNVMILKSVSGSCSVTSNSRNLYAKDISGNWYRYQPRLMLFRNTIDDPDLSNSFSNAIYASRVPKDFINQKGCKILFNGNSLYKEVCGSPGEVENDPKKGHQNNFFPYYSDPDFGGLADQRSRIWANIALFSSDQIRQRVAWALSQIFVINLGNLLDRVYDTEFFLKYYDIFVRNAFGNYFDVMKEVAYSPAMGFMMSYALGKSFQVEKAKPDENFARELMQLFSIGIWKLNKNGTQIFDSNGNPLETYTTLDIQNFARVWTGLKPLPRNKRGNIETQLPHNMIDTMMISPSDHDTFPKNGLDGSYIGDGYPLCRDLPQKLFLRKGALYQFIDMENLPVWSRILRLERNSQLFNVLCNPDSNGNCQFKSTLTLQNTIQCSGIECEIERIHFVEILSRESNVYFEYVRPPCVQLTFPEATGALTGSGFTYPVCVDKQSARASPCCSLSKNSSPSLNTKYLRESTSYSVAESRCLQQNRGVCSVPTYLPTTSPSSSRFWTNSACNIQVQIYDDGQISEKHAFNFTLPTGYRFTELDADSGIKFRVNWLNGEYPKSSENCAGICTVQENSCICPTKTTTSTVFTDINAIPPKNEILRELKIGALDPLAFDLNEYTIAYNNDQEGLKIFVDSTGKLNSKSIFQVRFAGSENIHLANIKIDVFIADIYRFRNVPNFMRIEEKDVRDVQNEIDAVLKHYLYHQNNPPFVADLLIKRFVSSNPSPAYIESVSNAFINGIYEGIGSGRYGDLSATIAATLLYRDALSPVLKSDTSHGKIREPILKVIHLMRSLGVVSKKNRDISLIKLDEILGQEPFNAPTVFNYYISKFQPNTAVKRANLYAPEAQLLTSNRIVGFLNAMYSMIEFGITGCFDSLTTDASLIWCGNFNGKYKRDPFLYNSGFLTYNSSTSSLYSTSDIISYFNVLLTGGRLDFAKRDEFSQIFDRVNRSFSRDDAIKVLLELYVTAPEYQISALAKSKSAKRTSPSIDYSSKDYKAIVYLYLGGGMDSYNLLVPHSECGNFDYFQQYQDIRTNAALSKNELLEISTPDWGTPQPCRKFGVLGRMSFLRDLYNSGEAAFISNIGALIEPLNSNSILSPKAKKPLALFAHEMQTQHAETVRADAISSSGILGRISEQLSLKRLKASCYSVSGKQSNALEEPPGLADSQIIIDPKSEVSKLDKYQISDIDLHNITLNSTSVIYESIFADTWNEVLNKGLKNMAQLEYIMRDSSIPKPLESKQMDFIARTIASRAKLNSTVDMFDYRMGGFDTHSSFGFVYNMKVLNLELQEFVTEIKRQGVWDNVLIVMASEFGRTLRSNRKGTDHGWGGNTFIMGGSVRGGQILGKFPSRFDDPDLHIGNGILIPTTPWEGMWNGIAQWAGVDDNALDKVLPNRKNFLNGDYLFTKDRMFKK